MAYFNHAFQKIFLGTKKNLAAPVNANQSAGGATTASGFIINGTYGTKDLIHTSTTVGTSNLGIGSYGFFDPNTWSSINNANLAASGKVCCPLVLAATALYQKDQISGMFTTGGGQNCQTGLGGGFQGGYQESNKSKVINPKYLSRFYKVTPCTPNQNVIHVGSTPYNSLANGIGSLAIVSGGTTYAANGVHTGVALTGGTGTGAYASVTVAAGIITVITITTPGSGYSNGDTLAVLLGSGTPALTHGGGSNASFTVTLAAASACCFTFLCDQAYTLRLDIKGSPALRFLDHNGYFEASTWTGCCPAAALAPIAVDPTTVFIHWATQFLNSPLINPFIQIIVYDQNGVAVGGPNDLAAWCAYVPQAVIACIPGTPTPGAGMSIIGAYVGTVFGDCTFYPTDFFEKEPVHIYASMVDLTGSVCDFTGICVTESCCPRQGNGFGDTVLKDLILSERYQTNDFYTGTDLRIREITQGYDISSAVNRSAFYTRYFIQHNVPRFNNPTGVFDNDQYLLEIITNGTDTNLEAFMAAWTAGCAPCPGMETYSCGACCPIPAVAPNGTVGVAYSFTVAPTFGTSPYTWSIDAADAAALLALGLTLNLATGEITGVGIAGTANVTITVTDAYNLVVLCETLQITVV